jgi:hypothetical protein
MRKPLLTAIAGALIGASATVALANAAAPEIRAHLAAAPLTAGTPAHPQGVRLQMGFGWQGYDPADQPMVTGIDVWFPRGSVYNGARYPSCSVRRLDAAGPAGCPKGSIMGSGGGVATADQTITRPQITVVNGGPDVVYFYTVLNNPARVQQPVVGHITRLGGQFTYHLSATIPEDLRIVAGVPIKLTSLEVTAGRGDWLATTNSPAGIKVQTTYDSGATTSNTVWVSDL